MEQKQKILEIINSKGWNLYYRGKLEEKIDPDKTYKKGPVKILEKGISYILLPSVKKPTDPKMIQAFLIKHQFKPKIIVPQKGLRHLGRMIVKFSGGDTEEMELRPGEEIIFIGIELLEKEIRLLSPSKTFMPYDVFLEALNTLEDITALTVV